MAPPAAVSPASAAVVTCAARPTGAAVPTLARSGAVLSVCAALAAFLLLLAPIGFVGASTAMFVMVARGFDRSRSAGTSAGPARPSPAVWIVAPAFCLLVYLAFTRGLDLPLPEARLWSWMR